MKRLVQRAAVVVVATGVASVLAGCTIQKQDAPPLSGPSEFGRSLAVTASPDVITQDGASQSLIGIIARDAQGGPMAGAVLRVEIYVGGQRVDFGSLSPSTITTGQDGRATAIYTAPPPPTSQGGGFTAAQETLVTIAVTPLGTNFAEAHPRLVDLKLVPPGTILPPVTFIPDFTFTPEAPIELVDVTFDASSTIDPDSAIVSLVWDFDDGGAPMTVPVTTKLVKRRFTTARTFLVTLSARDAAGRSRSVTKPVTVGEGDGPTATFTFSPTAPCVGDTVVFSAVESTGQPGRPIRHYFWMFGDSDDFFTTGVVVTHVYAAAATYVVTLEVTDTAGKQGIDTQEVPVGEADDCTE